MRAISTGLVLERCGMRLDADLGPGLIGQRWSVRLVHQQPGAPIYGRIADVVEVQDPIVDAQCDQLTRLGGIPQSRGVGSALATEWIDDQHFAAVWDLSPQARTLASFVRHSDFTPPDEQEFWPVAAMLYRAVSCMHRARLVHGPICPNAYYVDGESLVLSDLWWVRPFGVSQLNGDAPEPSSQPLPPAAHHFSAPEIRAGELPTQAGDLFSLGAVLQFLLTTCPHGTSGQTGNDATPFQTRQLDPDSERGRFTLALTKTNPAERLSPPQIEAWLHEKLLRRVSSSRPRDWEVRLTSEFGVSLHGVPPHQLVDIVDLYQCIGTLLLACRQDEREAGFVIEGLLLTGGRTYLALADSPEHSERLDYVPLTVVRLENDWQFRTIDEQELLAVREDLTANVYRGTSRDLAYAQFLLGPIREWKQPNQLSPGQLDTTDWTHRAPESW